jgi:hypothetical protein
MASPAEMSTGYSDFRPAAPPAPAPDVSQYTPDRALRILRDGVRPEDCLPITDEVRRIVSVHEQYFTERLGGVPPAASYMHHIWVDQTLAAHLPDQHVVFIDDEKGVAVLAVGLDAMSALLGTMPVGREPPVSVTYVEPMATADAFPAVH